MKSTIAFVAIAFACVTDGAARADFEPPVTQSIAVTAAPLWTDSGYLLRAGDHVTFSGAAGAWTWGGGGPLFGPDGDPQPGLTWDEWITDGQHGQLIGVVLPDGVDPNAVPRVVAQNDPALFVIGSGTIDLTGVSGRLWLGFNDDYQSLATGDNAGAIVVLLTLLLVQNECVKIDFAYPFNLKNDIVLKPCVFLDRAGIELIIRIDEGPAFNGYADGFDFFSVIGGGANKYMDTDSAQAAVRMTDGSQTVKQVTNANSPATARGNDLFAAARWTKKMETRPNRRVEWPTSVPARVRHIDVALVYTDLLFSTPADAEGENGYGDMPGIIGSWTLDLKAGTWNVVANPGDTLQPAKKQPAAKDIPAQVAAVQKLVKDKTGYDVIARPIGLKGISFPTKEIPVPMIKDIIAAAVGKAINGKYDTGFDVNPM